MAQEYQNITIIDADDPLAFPAITVKYVPPEVSWNKSANYGSVEILSRYAPVPIFLNGGAKTMSFTLELYAETDVKSEIRDVILLLESFLYPVEEDRLFKPPHRLFLKWGQLFEMLSIVKSVTPTFSGAIDTITGIHYHATVAIELEEFLNTSTTMSMNTIRAMRGI